MRANPLVCVEMDGVTAYDQWLSVIALGRYEELPEDSECDEERLNACAVLNTQPVWWQPGSTASTVQTSDDQREPFIPVYYKIWIDHISGRAASRDPQEMAGGEVPLADRPSGLRNRLSPVLGDKIEPNGSPL